MLCINLISSYSMKIQKIKSGIVFLSSLPFIFVCIFGFSFVPVSLEKRVTKADPLQRSGENDNTFGIRPKPSVGTD